MQEVLAMQCVAIIRNAICLSHPPLIGVCCVDVVAAWKEEGSSLRTFHAVCMYALYIFTRTSCTISVQRSCRCLPNFARKHVRNTPTSYANKGKVANWRFRLLCKLVQIAHTVADKQLFLFGSCRWDLQQAAKGVNLVSVYWIFCKNSSILTVFFFFGVSFNDT